MSYLPKSEIVGVLAPSSINTRDVGKNWFDIGAIVTANFLTYLGNGIVIAGNGGEHIFRSVDYGNTWTDNGAVSVNIFNSATYLGNGIVIAVDSNGHVFRSIDFGVNWTDEGDITGAGNALETISYLGNGIVIIGASNRHIYRNTNFGIAPWTDLGIITASAILASVYLENGIALVQTTSHLWRSIDFGATWTDLGSANVPFIISDKGFSYLGNGIVIATGSGAGNQIFRSNDFGLTWTTFATFGTGVPTNSYLGDGVVIAGTNGVINGHILRSENFGISFTDIGAISANGITKSVYLDNGVAIIRDSAGEFFRSDVSYKTNESQVKIEPSFITTNADIAITQAHYMVNVDASGANRTITLANPALLQIGHEFIIKKIDATANTVTISTVAGNIDGVASKVLNVQWQSITVRTDGINYFIV